MSKSKQLALLALTKQTTTVLTFGFLLLFVLLSFNSSAEKKKSIPPTLTKLDIIDEAQHATCQIIGVRQLPSPVGEAAGSCFFINDEGYLITNAHVLHEVEKMAQNGYTPQVVWPFFDSGKGPRPLTLTDGRLAIIGWTPSTLERIDVDENADVALLRTKVREKGSAVNPHCLKLRFKPVSPGFEVAVTGYPLYEEYPVTVLSVIATQKRLSVPTKEMPIQGIPNTPFYLIDKPLFHGFSGSPVYSLENGDVIAIAASFKFDSILLDPQHASYYAALGRVLDLRVVQALLDRNHVSYKTSEKVQ